MVGLGESSRARGTIKARWDGGASAPKLDANRVAVTAPLKRRDGRHAMSLTVGHLIELLVNVKGDVCYSQGSLDVA
jgi:hypothetical protein